MASSSAVGRRLRRGRVFNSDDIRKKREGERGGCYFFHSGFFVVVKERGEAGP